MKPKAPRCLSCYQPLSDSAIEYHPSCARKLFGINKAPELDFSLQQIKEIASEEVNRRISVPGVLPKLSLELRKVRAQARLTIVQLWGTHAFKPPTEQYPHLPENEDVCMHLAEICGFKVAVHGLIRFKTGELAYITKRFDRAGSERLHQEDFCQLTETLTENKYQSSVERIGKAIQRYATNPGVDCINFYEQVIFSFLIGNADMHLKNYSLIRTRDGDYTLSPAYDLVATKLAVPKDLEESALSIHGKKKNITRSDLLNFGETLLIPEKVLHTSLEKLLAKLPELCAFVRNSFLPAQQQEQLIDLMRARGNRLSKTKA